MSRFIRFILAIGCEVVEIENISLERKFEICIYAHTISVCLSSLHAFQVEQPIGPKLLVNKSTEPRFVFHM